MRYALNLTEHTTIDSAKRSIPRWNATELDLSYNTLSTKQPNDILTLLGSIPASISTLNLTQTGLGQINNSSLIELLQTIPAHINTLILTQNGLGSCNKTDEELCAIFSAISNHTSIHALGLACNDLGTRDNPEIFNALRVNTVNLRHNHLERLSPQTFVAILHNHHTVHIGNHEFTPEQLHAMAAGNIDTLEHLDLRASRLDRHPEALRALISSLPALKTLGLADNELGRLEKIT
ncbi:MAG: hypothetical protein GW760_07260 [Legionella sp.]|nr:hypothetical protein [Legionella sp.]